MAALFYGILNVEAFLFVAGILIGLYIVYLSVLAIYNVYFHPLANFPGPILAAASQIPVARATAGGRLSYWLRDLHEKYSSDVVRISPNELSFISASAWNDMVGYRQGHREFEKDALIYAGVKSLLTANNPDHSRQRRILDHAFTQKALREQEPYIQKYVDVLMSRLEERAISPNKCSIDLVQWYNWLSFDIIGDLSFGQPFDCLKDSTYHPWVSTIFATTRSISYLSVYKRFPPAEKIMRYLLPVSVDRKRRDHMAITEAKVNQRKKAGTTRRDFMSYILENNSAMGLSEAEMQANASLLIVAGSDTTATLISGATYHLLRNPAIMTKLVAEIRSAFSSSTNITLQSIGKLEYLLAVLNESLRIYPPALAGQPRVVPKEGAIISGYWIPGGTGVQMNQYAAYHSHLNFQDPTRFAPERWLGDSKYTSDRRDVVQPFSTGPRNCIGKNLAHAEARLTLTKLLWNFDLGIADEEGMQDWADQKNYLTWEKKPLMVDLKIREKEVA
ncbi:MAG: hypothetical protein M1827_005139 [Pycnora praestabilis]|nr:MAG: hypothetical protein M1827_005139 [Pycnora praestabilis]